MITKGDYIRLIISVVLLSAIIITAKEFSKRNNVSLSDERILEWAKH